MEEQVVVNKLW